MHERAHRVHVRVAVRDHHALGARSRAARVVDGDEVGLADLRTVEGRGRGREQGFVIEPAGAGRLQGHESLHVRQLAANRVHRVQVIRMRAHDLGSAVLDEVREVGRGQAVVDGHDHGADLGDGVERLELGVRVGRDVGDTIAGAHAELLQRGRPAVAALEELTVREAQVPVDDGLTFRVEPARAPRELEGREREFHDALLR